MGRQIGCLLILLTSGLRGEEAVRINLVARSKVTHRPVLILAKDLEIRFDGARQTIHSFQPLGCKQDSPSTAAVILSSTEILQVAIKAGGIGGNALTESGVRQAQARKILDRLPQDMAVEAYAWAPRLIPIRLFQEDGRLEIFSPTEALRVFDRRTAVLTTGGVIAENHLGNLARWSDMEILANHLAGRPGRKALVWYCTNFGDRPDGPPTGTSGHDLWSSALRAMNREDVAVYPIDCSVKTPQPQPDYAKLIKREPIATGSLKMDRFSASERVIADYTGGTFYTGMDKLESAIREGLADSRCSYEVTWSLSGQSKNRRRPVSTSRIHSVQVTTSNSDLDLRYPKVYLEAELPVSEPERLKLAEGGLTYRIPLYAIPVRASWNGATPQIRYRTTPLTFLPDASGLPHAELDVIWAYYDASGTRIKAGKHSTVRLTPKGADLRTFQEKEQLLEGDAEIPTGAAELRVLVREPPSGRMGTAFLFVPPKAP